MNDAATQKYINFVLAHTNGNPNGDPDNGNAPRRYYTDERMLYISDVSVKRRLRNYWYTKLGKDILYKGVDAPAPRKEETEKVGGKGLKGADAGAKLREAFLDVRLFGAVATAGKGSSALALTGCVQGGRGHSLHPVQMDTQMTITGTNPDKLESTFGDKHSVPVVYTKHCFLYTPPADGSVSNEDLDFLYGSIVNAYSEYSTASKPLAWFVKGLVVEASQGVGQFRPLLLGRTSPFTVSPGFEEWGKKVPLFPEDVSVAIDGSLVAEMREAGIKVWELK